MASLYQSLLEDPRIEFATSSEQGQRLAQLQRTFQQAGLAGGQKPGQAGGKPLQAPADPTKGPFAGMGLQGALGDPFQPAGRVKARGPQNTGVPKSALQQAPQFDEEAPQGDEQQKEIDDYLKSKKPKDDGTIKDDWGAQIARIQAEYERDRAARDAQSQGPRAAAMTPTQGPDTGAPNPNASSGPIAPSSAAFVKAMTPHALRVAAATGVDPKLVLAQAALETGWGQHAPNNNVFGIKGAGPSQQTWEVGADGKPYQTTATFRAYKTPGESFDDYGRLLQSNSRYAPVLAAKTLPDQIAAMGNSGYATDPRYADKLTSIVGQLPELDTTDSASQPTVTAQNAMRRGGFFSRK
jgi:flagellum-specific peptidoglycan hydrolase FlgJ